MPIQPDPLLQTLRTDDLDTRSDRLHYATGEMLGQDDFRAEQLYHRRLHVTHVGKITTALLLVGFADLILAWPMIPGAGLVDSPLLPGLGSHPAPMGIWFVYAGMCFSIAAAIQYSFIYLRTVREAREELATAE